MLLWPLEGRATSRNHNTDILSVDNVDRAIKLGSSCVFTHQAWLEQHLLPLWSMPPTGHLIDTVYWKRFRHNKVKKFQIMLWIALIYYLT